MIPDKLRALAVEIEVGLHGDPSGAVVLLSSKDSTLEPKIFSYGLCPTAIDLVVERAFMWLKMPMAWLTARNKGFSLVGNSNEATGNKA